MSALHEQRIGACVTMLSHVPLPTRDSGADMIIQPGKHRPQGPWDPNETKKYFDTTEAWLWLPMLGVVGALVAAVYFFG